MKYELTVKHYYCHYYILYQYYTSYLEDVEGYGNDIAQYILIDKRSTTCTGAKVCLSTVETIVIRLSHALTLLRQAIILVLQ